MTDFIKLMPLFGAIVGILLCIFIFLNKKTHQNNKAAKVFFILILFMTSYSLLNIHFSHLNPNVWLNLAYYYYHLTGFVFLLYANSLLDLKINLKSWGVFYVLYSLIHILVAMHLNKTYNTLLNEEFITRNKFMVVAIDYYLSLFLNLLPISYIYLRIKKIKSNTPNLSSNLNFIWAKKLIGNVIVIYLAIIIPSLSIFLFELVQNFNNVLFDVSKPLIILGINIDLSVYEMMEAALTSLFIFVIAILAIRIPIFSSHRYLLEDSNLSPQKKYAKSTLKKNEQDVIWQQLQSLMHEKKLYRKPTLRLTNLAEEIGKPLPHVSQVINEKFDMNFLDFVNQYRVEEAKKMLLSPKFKSFTILAIAYEVGFNSKTAFYSSFKKVTGTTPSSFKKSKQ